MQFGVVDGGECGENGVPVHGGGGGHYGYGILMAAVFLECVCAEREGESAGRSRRKRERRAALDWVLCTVPASMVPRLPTTGQRRWARADRAATLLTVAPEDRT